MRKSVAVMMHGGLGNQMFQYAIGRALSIRLSLSLTIDISLLKMRSSNETRRVYELGCFRLSELYLRDRAILVSRATRILSRGISATGLSWTCSINERGPGFDATILRVSGPCQLEGYWQSEQYFAFAESQLRSDFRILKEQDHRSFECETRIRRVKSVALHVRRGDYASPPNRSIHSLCPKAYYDEALKLIQVRLGPQIELFVFSDDMEWTRRNMSYPIPTTYVDWNAERGYEDLRLMSACKALVIANSTFSWWAGWLNPDPDKLVIGPKDWYRAPGLRSDLLNSSWLIAI